MRVTLGIALRAGCLAAGLWLADAEAGEPVSPLMGATRAQVLSRYGEPRSQIESGDRLIFLYPRERVTFRGDVVVDVEPIVPEPVRRPPPAETPPAAAAGADPAAPASPTGAAPEAAAGGQAPTSPPDGSTPQAPSAPLGPPPPLPEPKVEIKLVRPPGSKELPAPLPPRPAPVAPVVTAPVVAEAAPKVPEPAPTPVSSTALSEANEARKAAERAAAAEKEQKEKARKDALRRLDEAAQGEAPTGGMLSGRTWLIIAGMLVGGVAFIFWRSRRSVVVGSGEAADKAVPVAGLAPAGETAGSSFTPEMLEELEWSRFERLVVSYYSKTGVVAVPTNAGPDAPVQIKISWKGEPRPFAYVRCTTNPSGVVDVKPLKELGAALAADDIRRGYVVTPGRFTPAARGLATEQQLTLMPGDVLLEKLNALPLSARKELMRDTGAA